MIKSRKSKVHDENPGFLRRARLRKAETRKSYSESWDKFISFCMANHLVAGTCARFATMHQLDAALEAFGEAQFLQGQPKYVLTCALQNCNLEYPCWPTSSRINFPLTKAAKKGWSNLEPGATKDPCPFEVAMLIAMNLVVRGLPYYAAAVVLAFDTYIRPGKLVELRHLNIIPPARGVGKHYRHWTILLHPQEQLVPSKTGAFNDSLVVGSKDRPWVGALCGLLFSKHSGNTDGALFPFNLDQFEKQFKASVDALKLQKLKLTPHCLRHGGASHDFLAGIRSLQEIQQRGCWACFESVRRYQKHGRISKQLNLLTSTQQSAAKQATLELPRLLLGQFG